MNYNTPKRPDKVIFYKPTTPEEEPNADFM